jgi:hypothetical protein
VTVAETADAKVPWRAEPGKGEHKFSRPSIYNGTPGKEEYELAPDAHEEKGQRVQQIWKLADYRKMNLFLRCRYQGTALTLVIDLPAELKTCSFSFRNVAGKPPEAPVFDCQ